MRVHRLVLRNYRGVQACELTFAERGVTVVEGDNEVGKSSAAEALHLLLEYRDDSSHRDVKAVRPLHVDAGAEVEVDLTVGRYRLTFAKRWHRDRYTRLRVLAPVAEVVNGREAHDRLRALLAETVDLELWRALSVPQAQGLERAALRHHPSLVAALDTAALGALGTAADDDLLERVATEASRWTTGQGRPRRELADARTRAADALEEVTTCERALAALEVDAAWCADLQRSADQLRPKITSAARAAEAADARHDALRRHHESVEQLAVRAELARSTASLAAAAAAARADLVARIATATSDRAEAEGEAVVADRAAADARVEADLAAAAVVEAAAQLVTAVAATDAAERASTAACEGARLAVIRVELGRLEAVIAEAERLEGELRRARAAVTASPSSPAALAGVQASHDDVLRAEAALIAGRASLHIEATSDLRLTVDGVGTDLPSGAAVRHGVTDQLVVELPGVARLTVAAGAGATALEERLRVATAALTSRCADLGVTGLAGARALEDERRRLRAEVTALEDRLAATLEGRTLQSMVAVADQARQLLATAPPVDDDDDADDEDLELLQHRLDEARDARRVAERRADRAEAAAAAAELVAASAAAAADRAGARCAIAETALRAAQRELAEGRRECPDDELAATAAGAAADAEAAVRSWQAAGGVDRAALAATDQERLRARAEHAGLERALARLGEDLAAIRARLELQGEAGLHDRLADAQRRASAATAERDAVEARAAAAQLLLTTLTRHRDEAARVYGAPLRARLESLGRLVFGHTFTVELDDDLRIAARVLDGVPVPWAALSVGVKEQLAVLSRLAAATLVSADGGVPVIFDDVLGFSDPGRTALVSTAFEAAAEDCQIIVLTCDPGRFRSLARATTHCLTGPRDVDARQAG